MDGEQMTVTVDVQTHQAATNVDTLTKALEENAHVARLVEHRHEAAERKMRELADAAAAESRVLQTTTKDTRTYTDALVNAAREADTVRRNVDRMGDEGARAAAKLRHEKGTLGTATTALTGQVQGLVGAYLGLNGIVMLFDRLTQRARELRQAQQELVGGKWDRDAALLTVMDNLGISGRVGEDRARGLVNQFAKATASTFDTSLGSVAAATAAGFKLDDPNTMGAATAAGKFAGRMRFGQAESEQLFKLMSNQGVRDEAGAKSLLSKLEATARETGVTKNTELMGAMLGVVNSFTQRGGTIEEALAQYSTAATGSRSAEGGAEQVQMALHLVDPGTPEARGKLAAALARRGVIKGGTVSDAQIDAAIDAQQGTAAQSAYDLRAKGGAFAQADREQDMGFASRERELSLKARTAKSRAERTSAQEDLALLREKRMGDLEGRYGRDQKAGREMGDYRAKIGDSILGETAGDAFDRLPFEQKFKAVGAMFAEAEGDQVKQAELQAIFDGRPELFRSAMAQFSKAYRGRADRTRGAIAKSVPGTQDTMFELHKTTSFAQNATQSVALGEKDDAAVDSAEEQTRRLMDAGRSRGGRNYEKWARNQSWVDLVIDGREQFDAASSEKELQETAATFWASLSPEQKAANPQLGKLVSQIAGGGAYSEITAKYDLNVRDMARQFFRLKQSVGAGSAAPTTQPSGPGGAVPLPAGATSTGMVAPADEPQSSAAPLYNISIGNYFSGVSSEHNIPGRLEGFQA